ncbi:MAG: hypothetical protein HY304_07390 [candidate division Zixibacteria bacterium]|nr:hypothetical protein [candidate division Zixibacteria bacterium]
MFWHRQFPLGQKKNRRLWWAGGSQSIQASLHHQMGMSLAPAAKTGQVQQHGQHRVAVLLMIFVMVAVRMRIIPLPLGIRQYGHLVFGTFFMDFEFFVK